MVILVMMVMPENNLPLSKCSSCLKVAPSAISSCSSPTNSIHLDDKHVTKSNADNHYDVAQKGIFSKSIDPWILFEREQKL